MDGRAEILVPINKATTRHSAQLYVMCFGEHFPHMFLDKGRSRVFGTGVVADPRFGIKFSFTVISLN